MLFACWIIGCLLIKAVLASTCSLVFSSRSEINVTSKMSRHSDFYECQYVIRTPSKHQITVNFTKLYGFVVTPSAPPPPKVTATEKSGTARSGSYSRTSVNQDSRTSDSNNNNDRNNKKEILAKQSSETTLDRGSGGDHGGRKQSDVQPLYTARGRNTTRSNAGHGTHPGLRDPRDYLRARHCLPEIVVRDVVSRKYRILRRINCDISNTSSDHNFVVTSSNVISITYRWFKGHQSGFKVTIDVLTPRNTHICQSTCADSACIQTGNCRLHNCADESQTLHSGSHCREQGTTDHSPLPSSEAVQITVICVAIVLSVLLVVCIVTRQYCITRASRQRHSSQTSERACLQPQSQHSSSTAPSTEVVYLPVTYSEPATMPASSVANRSVFTPHNYPPSIPISRDGEEGYAYHQLSLQRARATSCDAVCVPPNCTVYDVAPHPPGATPPYVSSVIPGYHLWPPCARGLSIGGESKHTQDTGKASRKQPVQNAHKSLTSTNACTRKHTNNNRGNCDKNCRPRERHCPPRLSPSFCEHRPDEARGAAPIVNRCERSDDRSVVGEGTDRHTERPPDSHVRHNAHSLS